MTGKWIKFDCRGTLRIPPSGKGCITCIVSAFQNANALRCSLASLVLQKPHVQIVVTDNSPDLHAVRWNYAITHGIDATYVNTSHINGGVDPCDSANSICGIGEALLDRNKKPWGEVVVGEWLTFPSDDGYHVPQFSKIVLDTAKEHPDWDVIYWDILYDPRLGGEYKVMDAALQACRFDKTCFMIRRRTFMELGGFPRRDHDGWRDAALAELIVAKGIKAGKARGVLTVHN